MFIGCMFFLVPLLLLGVAACFEQGSKGFTALGIFLILLIVGTCLYGWIWWRYRNGKHKFHHYLETKRRQKLVWEGLADDLDYIKVDLEWCKNEIGQLKDTTTTLMMPIHRLPHEVDEEQGGSIGGGMGADDDIVTLYESTHSMPWKSVLAAAAGSIKSGFEDVPRTPSTAGARVTQTQPLPQTEKVEDEEEEEEVHGEEKAAP